MSRAGAGPAPAANAADTGTTVGLVLLGAAGRMGVAVERAAAAAGGFSIRARIERDAEDPGSQSVDGDLSRLAPGDVVVDFSAPAGTLEACRLCTRSGAGLVSGTTGLGAAEEDAIREASHTVPVLRAANFSLGVLALKRSLAAALAALPGDWDVEIIERHHRRKVDAPSGTALALAHEVARRRGVEPSAFRLGRSGRTGERPRDEVGIHAVRGGSWVGDHTVLVAGEGEWLELRHVAQDRGAFAHGVLAAARFVAQAAPGLYTLEDVAIGGRSI